MAEYVRFNPQENLYGQRNFLNSELDLLSIVKKLRNFKKLRADEQVLRLTLKKKMEEVIETLEVLDKLLPPGHFRMLKEQSGMKEKDETLTLDQEIEMIRRKLEKLRG